MSKKKQEATSKASKKPIGDNAIVSRTSTEEDSIIKKFISMSELQFTTEIVTPLFLKLGYSVIDYFGGPLEKGKDIVCQGVDKLGQREIAALQVKKWRITAKTNSKMSPGNIVSQLLQAKNEPIQLADGDAYADILYFITPYPIELAVVNNFAKTFEKELSPRNRLQLLDGIQIAKLVKVHLPSLYAKLSGNSNSIIESFNFEINNDPLMRALRGRTGRILEEYYTDIDLVIGNDPHQSWLLYPITPRSVTAEVNWSRWNELKLANQRCSQLIGVSFILSNIDAIQGKLQLLYEQYEAQLRILETTRLTIEKSKQEHQALYEKLLLSFKKTTGHFYSEFEELYSSSTKQVNELRQKIEDLRDEYEYARRFKQGKLEAEQLAILNKELARLTAVLIQLDSGVNVPFFLLIGDVIGYWDKLQGKKVADTKLLLDGIKHRAAELEPRMICFDTYSEFSSTITELIAFYDRFLDSIVSKEKAGDGMAEPLLTVELSGSEICKDLISQRARIRRLVAKTNSGCDVEVLRQLLSAFQNLFDFVKFVESDGFVRDLIELEYPKKSSCKNPFRLTIPISRFFDTGENLTILGEAGAGKTTSLMYYLKNLSREDAKIDRPRIFVPLGRMAKVWSEHRLQEPTIEAALFALLVSYGSECEKQQFMSLLLQEAPVLLLDGLDEATRLAPWLVEQLASFGNRFPDVQLIISSRSSEKGLQQLPFMSLKLLPFTLEQQKKFMRSWFVANSSKTEDQIDAHTQNIERHILQHTDIREVVTSPLLATVLCVLEENGVELPRSDVMLFSKRMKLQAGDLDSHRYVSRLKSDPEDLHTVARSLSFILHSASARAEELLTLRAIGLEKTRRRMQRDVYLRAFDELIDPCMIIVPMSLQGTYGFGHLSFQEFLVAEELCFWRPFRELNMKSVLTDSWWLNVCVYLSKLNGEFEWMIDQIRNSDLELVWNGNLKVMVQQRSKAEQKEIGNYIARKLCGRVLDRVTLSSLDGLVFDE